MTLRITLMWDLRETWCLTVKKWPWICLLLPSAEPNVPLVCLEPELGRCPVVRGGRRELVQEEHCLSSWQPGEQQTALHTRPQATWGVYWRRLWLGTPATGTPNTRPWPLHRVPGAPRHGEAGTVCAPRAWLPHPVNPGLPAPRVAVEARGSGRLLFWG